MLKKKYTAEEKYQAIAECRTITPLSAMDLLASFTTLPINTTNSIKSTENHMLSTF